MDNLTKAKYIVRRLQEIFPEDSEVIHLTVEDVIEKCESEEQLNFYVLAAIKECYCEKVC